MEDANRLTERELAVHIDLVATRTWTPSNEADIDALVTTLIAEDDGEDVDWVVGVVGRVPSALHSFDVAGKGTLVGKHIVLRAASGAQRLDYVEHEYNRLSDAQRRALEERLRRHAASVVFLHELGHTLGSPHEQARESIMYPVYDQRKTRSVPRRTTSSARRSPRATASRSTSCVR